MPDMPKYVLKNKRLSKTKTVFIFRRNYLNINDFKRQVMIGYMKRNFVIMGINAIFV